MAWPKLTKNANFGSNLVVFGQKILFFTEEIKSFVTHITENSPRHLVHIVFGRSLDKMCKKWQYLAENDQKCIFWTKFAIDSDCLPKVCYLKLKKLRYLSKLR